MRAEERWYGDPVLTTTPNFRIFWIQTVVHTSLCSMRWTTLIQTPYMAIANQLVQRSR